MSSFQSEAEFLKNYNVHDYSVPLITVDMAIFTVKNGALQVLLVKRAINPALGQWALPGGFVDVGEDNQLADTARRKLNEKTGVDTPYLEQVITAGNAARDPRGWSLTVAYFALIPSEDIQVVADASLEDVQWLDIDQALTEPLAFDHQQLLQACFERLQDKVQYTSLPINLLPEEFSLSELQAVFELLLGKKIEKKSFRRRIAEAKIVEETGNMRTGSQRPAKLYRAIKGGEQHFFNRNLEGSR